MKYTYIGTTVTGINRGSIEGEMEGNATPQQFIHGYIPSYYTVIDGNLTPLTQEEKDVYDNEQLFNSRKLAKREEIKAGFETDSVRNIEVNGTTFFGGKESAHDLKGSYDLLELGGATEMGIVDITSTKTMYSMLDALNIISTIALDYQTTLFKKHEKYVEIDAATTIEDLDLISW